MKRILPIILISILLSVVSAVCTTLYVIKLNDNNFENLFSYGSDNGVYEQKKEFVRYDALYPDFTSAVEKSIDAVVYVRVLKIDRNNRPANIFEQLFGFEQPNQRGRESMSSGSGVIISDDGYIVTNNHVVANGTEIEVTLTNNKAYKAKIVGADPATDIALLKIDGDNLPILKFASSDSLKLGEWVLAIGSPYNLRSTVTAGIVSAKGRSLPDMSGRFKIESFIQTDAAVNPGNSGGALVNRNGDLVGINTAIASQTGAFTGYSFAVPSSIVVKVVDDIKEFGKVQRVVLGISMVELTDRLAEQVGIKSDYRGAFIAEISQNGAAYNSGIRVNDVIVAVGGFPVKNPSEVQERVNADRPNDNVVITVFRNEAPMEFTLNL